MSIVDERQSSVEVIEIIMLRNERRHTEVDERVGVYVDGFSMKESPVGVNTLLTRAVREQKAGARAEDGPLCVIADILDVPSFVDWNSLLAGSPFIGPRQQDPTLAALRTRKCSA